MSSAAIWMVSPPESHATPAVTPGSSVAPWRATWRLDALLIVILLLVGIGLKAWLITHTATLARDGIICVLIAARYEQGPFLDVLRQTHQHPLFPLSVLGVQKLLGGQGAADWQLSAQIANSLAGLLMLVPVYLLGRELRCRSLGFWAALVIGCLPVAARHTADGVSEGTYLLFVAASLWLVACGFRRRSPWWFLLAGVAIGLGYLTRPEAVLVLVSTLVVLALVWLRGRSSYPLGSAVMSGAGLVMAFLLTVLPYWFAIGRLSNKPSVGEVLQQTAATDRAPELLFASRFMEGVNGEDWSEVSPQYALWEVLDESAKALQYVLWIPALAALLWFRQRWLDPAGLGLLAVLLMLNVCVLWRLALRSQYVSERHTLVIVLCGCLLAVAFLVDWVPKLTQRWPLAEPRRLLVCGLVLFCAWGILRTLRPLHANRQMHRDAGEWFAAQARPGDVLVDPYGFASFYAQTVPELALDREQPQVAQRRFLLVEAADMDVQRNQLIAKAAGNERGDPVAVWPSAERPKLVMYRADGGP